MSQPNVLCIMGPTAAGKTALALALAEHFPVALISVDSALVYRGMDIGTAKPDTATLARAPHALLDIVEPNENYSAGSFRTDALTEIAASFQRGLQPVLVGGTMLYYHALLQGIAEMPSVTEDIRQQLEQEIIQRGLPALHAELVTIDPTSAKRIHPNDPQRITRALGIYRATGQPLSSFWQQAENVFPYQAVRWALLPQQRPVWHQRIAARFRQMLDDGFVAEVERLRARGDLTQDSPAMRSVGYRQVWAYLDGDLSYDEMIERGIIATRQLAKRQCTWLRRETEAFFVDTSHDVPLQTLLQKYQTQFR